MGLAQPVLHAPLVSIQARWVQQLVFLVATVDSPIQQDHLNVAIAHLDSSPTRGMSLNVVLASQDLLQTNPVRRIAQLVRPAITPKIRRHQSVSFAPLVTPPLSRVLNPVNHSLHL